MHQLEAWHEFYLLIGTAGATLTGLLFIVVSLGSRFIADQHATGVRAFLSPNAVYFTTTLVVSAVLMAPGMPATVIGTFLMFGAVASLGYLAYTKAHQQWRLSELPFLDWVWYVGLPAVAYVVLLLAGIGFLMHVPLAMIGVAAAMVLLLVIGIRNAWDIVLYISQKENA
jgi:hypothetical protein